MVEKEIFKSLLPELGKRVDFDAVSIGLASPETIRSWSFGEVKNPETINYRTYKPEKGGLFCERIFGPQRDWECSCGKYKRIKHKGVVCDRCGVEVTSSRVRRERMGHIELAVPVSHIWFFKSMPSRIAMVLEMTIRELEAILYYEHYIVTDPGTSGLTAGQILTEEQYREAVQSFGDNFVAKMGAEAARDIMRGMELGKIVAEMEAQMKTTGSQQVMKKLSKRMKLLEHMRLAGIRPEWMILEVLPVIPPDLRPLVPLEGGRFACSDLNDLYRRVINRNNRLKNLLMLKTPDVIIRNEKRMLQESVDALLDNGRHGRAVCGTGNRPLKSVSDMLKGKQGRFRQNLLGKRVDYSGRSVIVVGPKLQINQCGLPKKIALVLFEPFIIRRLKEKGVAHTVRSAKKLIESQCDEVWDALDEVITGKTVLLNRAPTLHRLSVQAFEPMLIEGDAIQIHPLVCTAFNADFDGDQMAVHVPLSIEAQLEARLLMLSASNLFSPANGKPVLMPTQDIALGIYYLSMDPAADAQAAGDKPGAKEKSPPLFGDMDTAIYAFDTGSISLHDRIRLRNPDYKIETLNGVPDKKTIVTTTGRVILNSIFPRNMGFYNRPIVKKDIIWLVQKCYDVAGRWETIRVLDKLKETGFEFATRMGISIGMSDMVPSPRKDAIISQSRAEIAEVEKQYRKGIITEGERKNKMIDIWNIATDDTANTMFDAMRLTRETGLPNPLYMMVDSGARGSRLQIRQLAGMRGLMAKPSGDIVGQPILSNFRDGLNVLEYFLSTHGARKGLADTALKTADAGYLTRKLVDVAHDVIITEQDCNTLNGIELSLIETEKGELVPIGARVVGRTALDDIRDPFTNEIIVRAGQDISESAAASIDRTNIERVKIRSVLTCETQQGVCATCYGRDLSTGKPAELGAAVGIIAAQSIGEPGTQLTMRTFHIGGTASSHFQQPQVQIKNAGTLKFENLRLVRDAAGNNVVLNKKGSVQILDKNGEEIERHVMMLGSILAAEEGASVRKGQIIAKWDPYSVPVIAEREGVVAFRDLRENISMKLQTDPATGMKNIVILEHREDLHPQIILKTAGSGEEIAAYSIPSGAHVVVEEGRRVKAGEILAKTPRKVTKTKDITGGLPRVAELFEARRPKDAAEISKIAGIVEFGGIQRGRRLVSVKDIATGEKEEHWIPIGKHIIVFNEDIVEKGQPLTEGPVVLQEILDVCGPQALQEHLVNEVQEVYRTQGVDINDKHIEIIVRQMLRKVRITDSGDTEFLWGELIDKNIFHAANRKAIDEGKRQAEAMPALLGITKASIETESFISAASFQETTRVLTEAATLGKTDKLRGFKENVIMGHLIPSGVGFTTNKSIRLQSLGEPVETPVPEQPAADDPAGKLTQLLKGS